MTTGGVALATEDELSETVGVRLIEETGLSVDLTLRRGGSGYLKTNMTKWIAAKYRKNDAASVERRTSVQRRSADWRCLVPGPA